MTAIRSEIRAAIAKLNPKQRDVLDYIAIGVDGGHHPATMAALERRGLIESFLKHPRGHPPIIIKRYRVPGPIHMVWVEMCSEEDHRSDSMNDSSIQPGDICANCKDHVASAFWSGEMGALTAIRIGFASLPKWCSCCMLKAQIDYAEQQASKLPELRQKLSEACAVKGGAS